MEGQSGGIEPTIGRKSKRKSVEWKTFWKISLFLGFFSIICHLLSSENGAEVFRLRGQLEDSKDQLDSVKRENKSLGLEVKDLLDQIGEGGRSLHEVERQKRRLECEKEELANALDEAESALEAEENRVIRAEIELATLK